MADNRPYRPRLLWGDSYEYALDFGYPVQAARAYPRPMEGSEEIQLVSGVEDASVPGFDEVFDCTVRWIPPDDTLASGSTPRASGWEGISGWAAALKWLWRKNVGLWQYSATNLLYLPELFVDADTDGIADGWTDGITTVGGTATVVTGSGGYQQIARPVAPGTNVFHSLTQRVGGILPGEVLTLSVEGETTGLTGTANGYLAIHWLDSADGVISISDGSFTGSFARRSVTATAPASTVAVRVYLSLYTATGATGTARFKNAQLERASAFSGFTSSPRRGFYLVAPRTEGPGLEPLNARKTLALTLRASDGVAWEGY